MGLSLENVVKTTVFLKDMADFRGMNEVYGQRGRGCALAHWQTSGVANGGYVR